MSQEKRATPPEKGPVAPTFSALEGVSHFKLPLGRCRGTGGCHSYTVACRAAVGHLARKLKGILCLRNSPSRFCPVHKVPLVRYWQYIMKGKPTLGSSQWGWCRWGWNEFPFFFRFFSLLCLHFACVFFALFFFRFFFSFFFVFVFRLCLSPCSFFSLFFFFAFFIFSSFPENLVLSAHLQAVAVDGPSVFGHGENCKELQKGEFRSDPVYTNPVRSFPTTPENHPPNTLSEQFAQIVPHFSF